MFGLVTNSQIFNAISALQTQVTNLGKQILMSESQTQQDINNVATVLNGFVSGANTDLTTIQNALTTIGQQIANGQPVDTSALDTASQALSTVKAALDNVATAAETLATPPTTTTPTTPPAS